MLKCRPDVKISFEFFPPKSQLMEKRLWKTLRNLEPLAPDFVSVTYGAGGSTQKPTFEAVTRIKSETSLTPAAHLTCVGAPREDIDRIARGYWDAGIRHIVALRGDSPEGVGKTYNPVESGYAYGADLVAGLKRVADFDISVAAYPERHPESASWDVELDNLKRKVDAGATQAITQFFVKPDVFLRYMDRVRDAGITIPIIPGIMLQPNFQGLKRMADMCGVDICKDYAGLYEGLEDSPLAREDVTVSLVIEMTKKLRHNGVNRFHFYTLNRDKLVHPVINAMNASAAEIRGFEQKKGQSRAP
ncbi:MAG: methylenetetrahydrofolate reductase [NAD(P)H] [Hellea sp.]